MYHERKTAATRTHAIPAERFILVGGSMTDKMKSNYDRMADDAALLFLKYDQGKIISRWNLDADQEYLYLPFFSEENALMINRSSGRLSRIGETSLKAEGSAGDTGMPAPELPDAGSDLNMEAMILYDLLTYSDELPEVAGEWVGIAQLGGIIGAGHEQTLRSPLADAFAGRKSLLDGICREIGGVREGRGDVSCVFTVFRNFRILMQFWDEDDEFSASVRYMFDKNALRFMHYETLWYVMKVLERKIKGRMPEGSNQ